MQQASVKVSVPCLRVTPEGPVPHAEPQSLTAELAGADSDYNRLTGSGFAPLQDRR